ncbi:MAG: 23S rRNA (guanosine(2251)-2'-O)-methyltransferase RlmB, partial [Proteobacteria bacterium]|nr:23S rRNA (guanosine(2251)-2'-O)-methyltransferase RlmB [Pseudomonadota bacterium]
WIFGLDADGTTGLYDADLIGNIALIIGGEHKGIRPGVKKECDFVLSIPITGKVNSLNASVAGGVAMYEAKRQRSVNLKTKGK